MLPKEHAWLINHTEIEQKYAGEYIAILDESLVAHGRDLKQVFQEAKKHGANPYIHKVPRSDKDLVV